MKKKNAPRLATRCLPKLLSWRQSVLYRFMPFGRLDGIPEAFTVSYTAGCGYCNFSKEHGIFQKIFCL